MKESDKSRIMFSHGQLGAVTTSFFLLITVINITTTKSRLFAIAITLSIRLLFSLCSLRPRLDADRPNASRVDGRLIENLLCWVDKACSLLSFVLAFQSGMAMFNTTITEATYMENIYSVDSCSWSPPAEVGRLCAVPGVHDHQCRKEALSAPPSPAPCGPGSSQVKLEKCLPPDASAYRRRTVIRKSTCPLPRRACTAPYVVMWISVLFWQDVNVKMKMQQDRIFSNYRAVCVCVCVLYTHVCGRAKKKKKKKPSRVL